MAELDKTNLMIDISALNATADKQRSEIKTFMMNSIIELLPYFTVHRRVRNSKDLLTAEEGRILQPYDPDLTKSKTMTIIDKRTISVDGGQLYLVDTFEKYRDTYLATLEDLQIPFDKYPFHEWVVEYIMNTAMQDLHDIPFNGLKATNDPPEPVDITDGFFKIIDDEKTATNISVANGNLYELAGAATDYTASTIGDELKAQWDKFGAKVKKGGVDIWIPYEYLQMYKEWYKTEYTNVTDGDVPTEYLDGTNKKARFIWTESMSGSKKVIMTAAGNMCMALDMDNPDMGKLEFFKPNNNPNYLAVYAKMFFGFQIHTINKREFNVNNL